MLSDINFISVTDDNTFTRRNLVRVRDLKKLPDIAIMERNLGIDILKLSNIASYLGKDAFNVRGLDERNPRYTQYGDLCTTPKGVYMIFSRLNARENSPYRALAQSILLEILDRSEPFMEHLGKFTRREAQHELGLGASGMAYREDLARIVFNLGKFGADLTAREYAACIILDKSAPIKSKLLSYAAEADFSGAPRPSAGIKIELPTQADLSWLD